MSMLLTSRDKPTCFSRGFMTHMLTNLDLAIIDEDRKLIDRFLDR